MAPKGTSDSHLVPVLTFSGARNPKPGISRNGTPCAFSDDKDPSIVYQTAEHYMMYQKAILFNDATIAAQILSTPQDDPRRVKALGRQVSNFTDSEWNKSRLEIVRRGSLLKFTRPVDKEDGKWIAGDGRSLKEMLLGTGERELVEASPRDKIWGIGFGARNAGKVGRERWGLNLLGKALMAVREELAKGEEAKGDGKGEGGADAKEEKKEE
ncbi:Riboflavin biosynthesis protein PYRR, chloroplastic [Madurella mycetomatis]|uniref:Riboflavin biosynthesis protein PYRR, chloroplastic n=1 Tax=Madurella mycetomatis TaxID=100816 RepID=A0A175WFH6_9PEZI|nr:Riboflavin biosynthesis protein PYRR, chloroplastic [Madurella mycetomatis]